MERKRVQGTCVYPNASRSSMCRSTITPEGLNWTRVGVNVRGSVGLAYTL